MSKRKAAVRVRAEWDQEAGVWVAESTNLPGLVTEAETAELLLEKLRLMVPELLSYSPDLAVAPSAGNTRYVTAPRSSGPRRGLMADYADPVREAVRRAGCRFDRYGKGDGEIRLCPNSRRPIVVDNRIKSRHTANAILKQAGLPKQF